MLRGAFDGSAEIYLGDWPLFGQFLAADR